MTTLRFLTVGGILLAGYSLATLSNDTVSHAAAAEPLPGTKLLDIQGDVAEQMVAGIDRFLLGEIDKSIERRPRHWKRDVSSTANYTAALEPNRQRLAKILGAVDPRTPNLSLEYVATTSQPALVGRGEQFEAFAVRWAAVRGVMGEGLLLVPTKPSTIDVIAIPDADQTPEMLAGLMPGIEPSSQFARRLAESGCRVLIPTLIDRSSAYSIAASGTRPSNQPGREFLYRPAFEMGRHIIGYELQKILAAVDWFAAQAADQNRPLGVAGYGEGGLLALDSAALDPRIDAALVSGYFDSRQQVWQEPIYRNVQGLLDQFGDAELAAMIAPRALVIEACRGPEVTGPPAAKQGQAPNAAPGRLTTPKLASVQTEVDRARKLVAEVQPAPVLELVAAAGGDGPPAGDAALAPFLQALAAGAKLSPPGGSPTHLRKDFDPQPRLKRQFDQIAADTQHLLRESENVRVELWKKADRQSRNPDRWRETTRSYRDHFYNEVVGRFDQPLLPPNPRTRVLYDEPKWTGYEVQLDVFPASADSARPSSPQAAQADVFAYGILLMPKDIKPGEKRPVVVCQHGLEGRPTDVADPKADHPAYHRYAARLADEGFIVYAPQNPYIFGDKFRTLQRKANPLGKQLYSIIVPQHDQTIRWLATLPGVDPQRIAFYGLSYGGKTAMRVPAILEGYCLSICSADFNEWIWKNASLASPYSYVGTGEYEIFEFDLGNTYNYAEMAGLIAPRPFMVERGHRDGVAPDTEVAYEYAKIRLLYADLKIPERTEIEFFDGPHTINGVGTFAFLRKHLNWPAK
jgi:dienelactone hydrolase